MTQLGFLPPPEDSVTRDGCLVYQKGEVFAILCRPVLDKDKVFLSSTGWSFQLGTLTHEAAVAWIEEH